jgi:PKD domain-containing protein/IPT/TIG domain-containing protein
MLVALALMGLGASSASAVVVRLQDGTTLSYHPVRESAGTPRPFDALFSNLDYNGGPVMPSNTNYALYWAPSGSAPYPPDYQPGLTRYFEDLAHDSGGTANVESIAAQYNDSSAQFSRYSSHFGGTLIDTNPYPGNGCKAAAICLTDAQLRAELVRFVRAAKLPMDLTHQYFLLTPPGVENCFTKSGSECSVGTTKPTYCAYHGNIPVGEGQLIYSNDAFVTGNLLCDDGNHPNGTSDGALQGGLSHEHVESITDPEPNNAWTDFGGLIGEIGDKCRTFEEATEFGPTLGTHNGAKYNQVINGDFYWYQQEWSNQKHECLQRLSFSGAEPTATFKGTPGAGAEMKFDASGSSATGGVFRYNWQFNDAPPNEIPTPTETATPTISHTFPEPGIYTIALTVFAKDGTSIGTAHTMTVGKLLPPAVTGVAPKKGPVTGGTTVTITGAHFWGISAVRFGSLAAAEYTVNSTTSITAVSPPGTSGPADVTVSGLGGTSATSPADNFKFSRPTVDSVSPATGSKAGGATVTINGSGFAPGASGMTFRFGKALATGVSCSSVSTCTVTAPAVHKVGTVDVVAVVGGLISKKTAADHYIYV